MSVRVHIVDGPLAPRGPSPSTPDEGGPTGARLCFEGIVRAREGQDAIEALDYEAYEPMATNQLFELANDVLSRHRLHSVAVEHSRGRVFVGHCSFRLTITSAHRKEALAAMDEFIDRLKRDVPIWKRAV